MKVGDLVKFNEVLTGLGNSLGVVVGFDGACIEVRWIVAALRDGQGTASYELPEFLDVVSRV